VVDRELTAVQRYFGFTSWPDEFVPLDLGGRMLEVTGSPGHHRAAITIYDPWSGFLLTGDTIVPGRLYVDDMPQFLASVTAMVELAGRRPVTHVLGCHIEMRSAAGRDFPIGATYQPGERDLALTTTQLTSIRDAAAAVAARRGVHRFDDAILYNQPRLRDMGRLLGRGLAHKIRMAVRPR
jgi:glyoxylase-like metal-dependent hydrolase (beta-lactamase superfamily II)